MFMVKVFIKMSYQDTIKYKVIIFFHWNFLRNNARIKSEMEIRKLFRFKFFSEMNLKLKLFTTKLTIFYRKQELLLLLPYLLVCQLKFFSDLTLAWWVSVKTLANGLFYNNLTLGVFLFFFVRPTFFHWTLDLYEFDENH